MQIKPRTVPHNHLCMPPVMFACGYSLATNLPSLPQAVPRVKKIFETWTYLAVETLHSASMESSVQTLLACARCG